MQIENVSTLKIHKLSQEQYDRELAAGNIDEHALYLVPDKALDLSQYAKADDVNAMFNAISSISEMEIAKLFA